MELLIKSLALTINGWQIQPVPGFRFFASPLGTVLTEFLNVAFYMAGFLMIIWASWGVYEYLLAQGNKEALAKARNRIQWALIGFIIVILAFSISTYVRHFFPDNPNLQVKTVKSPTP